MKSTIIINIFIIALIITLVNAIHYGVSKKLFIYKIIKKIQLFNT